MSYGIRTAIENPNSYLYPTFPSYLSPQWRMPHWHALILSLFEPQIEFSLYGINLAGLKSLFIFLQWPYWPQLTHINLFVLDLSLQFDMGSDPKTPSVSIWSCGRFKLAYQFLDTILPHWLEDAIYSLSILKSDASIEEFEPNPSGMWMLCCAWPLSLVLRGIVSSTSTKAILV